MKPQDLMPAALMPPREHVELALAHIEGSAAFRTSRRHRALLRHLVERAMAGEVGSLKETVIAVEVFERSASRFDPKSDTIVRVETRRLRARLDSYFRSEGRESPLRIELPVGSYVPVIAQRLAQHHASDATRRARDLTERGEHFLRQALSPSSLEQALARFDEALRESPDFVPALVGVGRSWHNLATGWYREPAEAAAHAAEALRRALVLDDGNAVAHALLGAIEHNFERDWQSAQRSFRRAVQRAPEMAFVHSAYGCHLIYRTQFDQADAQLSLARRLDPQYINARMHMINLRIGQGRHDDAQAELDAMRDVAPDNMPLEGLASLLAMLRGDAAAAVMYSRRAVALAPTHAACGANLAAALGFGGRLEEADAAMAQAHAMTAQQGAPPLSPYIEAVVATRCSRTDAAFDWLDRAADLVDPNAVIAPCDPSFLSLHNDARWPGLVTRLRTPRQG